MKRIIASAAIILAMTACQNNRTNPFLTEWDTPYGIPPFEQILPSDFIPAVKAGIEQQNAEIDAITANPDAPTFENTIVPLELSGDILAKVTGVFYNITETDRNDALAAIEDEFISLMSEHENNLSFNKALYNRIAAVYHGDQSNLTREQQMALKKHFDGFEREGIGLPEEQQARLRQINADIAAKTQKIGNNILAESNDFLERFGFSVAAYPDKMTTTEDRELRRQYNEAYTSRGHRGNEYDNRQLLLEVLDLRAEKARILGYPNAAAYILSNKMAGTPETVDNFLAGIMKAAVAKAKVELADMQAVMDQDVKAGKLPAGSKIEPWDWWYYAEKVRKAKYDLDESLTKPYFQIDSVVNGIFTNAHILYGVNFERLEDVPVYNPEVRAYKVTAEDGSLLGIFTTDYKPRARQRSPPDHRQRLQLLRRPALHRRRRDGLPRVWPRPARAADQVPLRFGERHQRHPRLRGDVLPVQRELGLPARNARPLRQERAGRDHPRGARPEDPRRQEVQPGLHDLGALRRLHPRHALA